MQAFQQDLVFRLQLAAFDLVVQVQVESPLADAVAGELAGIGRQGGQLDALEAGGDVELLQRVEWVQFAGDGHRCVLVDLALDVHLGRLRVARVEGADFAAELLDGGTERRHQGQVGEVRRAVVDPYAADVDAQRLARRRVLAFGGGLAGRTTRLRDDQLADVGAAIFVDDEAGVGLLEGHALDRQAVLVPIGEAVEGQLGPFDEVAVLDGIQGMQLADFGAAVDAEGQRLDALQVDRQLAAKEAAAQFQADERRDVGLGHAQVDVAGTDLEPGADRVEHHLAAGLDLAAVAEAGLELEVEGGLAEAVDVLQVEVQRADFQRDLGGRLAIHQVRLVAAQLGVAQDDVPGLGGRLRGGFRTFRRRRLCSAGELLRLVVGRLVDLRSLGRFLPGCLAGLRSLARLLLGYFFIGSAAFRGLGGLFVVRCPFRLGDAGALLRRPVLARFARGYRGCLGGTVGCRFAGGLRRVGRGSGGIGVFRRLGRRRLAWRRSEVGEQFLPVELAVLLARGPGFQALATDFAEHHFLLGQVQGGSGHVEAGELGQRLALRRIDAEVGEFQRGLVEQQLGVLGQVQAIVAGEADHAVLQHQRGIVADIGPPGLELDILDAQVAPGRDRHQGQVAFPVEAAAVRAGGDQGHLRAVVGQGAEVVQLEAQRIEAEVHRLARSQVLEVQAALGQLDAVDAQRERVARLFRLGRFARRDPEQAGQVELALLVEQQFGMRTFQLDVGQVQLAFPQAVQLQVGVQPAEGELGVLLLAQAQTPEGQFQAEGVEFDTFEMCGDGGVLRQLLVGDAQPDAGYEQKAQQAIDEEGDQQGADSAFQSFGHGSLSFSVLSGALEYGTASRFRP